MWNFTKKTQIDGIMNDTLITIFSGCFLIILNLPRNNFKWEYPMGVPSYGTGKKPAAVDIVFTIDNEKWIAVEIELVGAGKEFEDELMNCVDKLKTAPICREHMSIGFIRI